MFTASIQELPFARVKSLSWDGDHLVDWLGGTDRYGLDGSHQRGQRSFAYRFDSVVQSPSGRYRVVYERTGTKGLVIDGREVLREINRSYYQAHAYDYPVTLFRLPDGREALAHCPDEYNVLQIELLETGERLTDRPEGAAEGADYFHSGLITDPSGQWLASVGWIWHPFCTVSLYPVAEALRDPTVLDDVTEPGSGQVEVYSATFVGLGRIVVASSPDAEDFLDEEDAPTDRRLRPGTLGVYRLEAPSMEKRPGPPHSARGWTGEAGCPGSWETLAPLEEAAGVLLPVDRDHVLALYEHPRLVQLSTGAVLQRWPEIDTGTWGCCINRGMQLPPHAWDPVHHRLAVAAPDRIQVLQL